MVGGRARDGPGERPPPRPQPTTSRSRSQTVVCAGTRSTVPASPSSGPLASTTSRPSGSGTGPAERLLRLCSRWSAGSAAPPRSGRAAGGADPRLGHGDPRRVVLVPHLAPLAEDAVHLIAVPQRMAAVLGQFVRAVARMSSMSRSGSARSLARPWATLTRKPATPRSDQKRSVVRKSVRTSGWSQFRSGCSGANRRRYHCPSGSRVHAGPPKQETQSVGGSEPSGPRPSRKTYRAWAAAGAGGAGRWPSQRSRPRSCSSSTGGFGTSRRY